MSRSDSPPRGRPVLLLTDFGSSDEFAGVCEAVIVARAPGTQVVHLTHGIQPQFVLQGAIVLRNTLPYTPVGVHLAVVDPGVGTERLAVAVDCADGRSFVGPDNGLLSLAIDAAGGAVRCVSIEDERFMLAPVSPTFHGRDIFAPAAAHLAAGGAIGELGPDVDATALARVELPQPRRGADGLVGEVWSIDSFGNVALALDEATLLDALGAAPRVELSIRNDRYYATVARTFGSVRIGEILLFIDSYGAVSVAVNQGNAAEMFRARMGDDVAIRPLPQ